MPLLGQALNAGWWWSGTKVCHHGTTNTTECWEYTRAPAEAFATVSYPPPPPPPPPPGGGGGGPNIGPIAPPPGEGNPSGQPILVTDKACGTCRKPSIAPTVEPGGVPTQPGTRQAAQQKQGLPWWVILLAVLLATKVVSDE